MNKFLLKCLVFVEKDQRLSEQQVFYSTQKIEHNLVLYNPQKYYQL